MTDSPSSGETKALAVEKRFFPGGHVSLHFLDQEAVLFDARAQRLYALNKSGAFIWCLAEEEADVARIADRMRTAFGTVDGDALSQIDEAFARWTELGLGATSPAETEDAALVEPPRAVLPNENVAPSQAPARTYRLLDLDLHVRGSLFAPLDELHHFLSPMSVAYGPASADAPHLTLDIVEDDGCFAVLRDGNVIERWLRADEIIPVVKRELVEAVLAHSGDFGALHAAGICGHKGDCTLVVGASGSGKSTLTAAVMATGMRILGDDTIVLARNTIEARPVPFGIGLKEGAWYLLAERFPSLAEQPIYRRQDGTGVRYLQPPSGEIWTPPASSRVASLVFLDRRAASEPATLERLTPSHALRRLVAEFCPLGGGLTADKVDRLVRWIGDVSCFSLRFADLDEGVAKIREISN